MLPGPSVSPAGSDEKPFDLVVEDMSFGPLRHKNSRLFHLLPSLILILRVPKMDVSDDSWPSISSVSSGDALEISFGCKPVSLQVSRPLKGSGHPLLRNSRMFSPRSGSESEDDASTWPSITFDDQQDFALTQERNTKEAGSTDTFASNFSDESSALSDKPVLEQDESNSILKLSYLDQSVEDQSKQMSKQKPAPNLMSDDSLQGLGELRFAEDD